MWALTAAAAAVAATATVATAAPTATTITTKATTTDDVWLSLELLATVDDVVVAPFSTPHTHHWTPYTLCTPLLGYLATPTAA